MRWLDEWTVLPLVLLAVMSTYSLVGLVAIWGVRARGPWFLRMAAVLAFPAAWLWTTDRRLCLLFLTQTAVVVLRLGHLQSRDARKKSGAIADSAGQDSGPTGRRFSLRDLLLVFVLLGGVFAMLARLPPHVRWDWYLDVLPGAVLGVFTLVAVRVAHSDRNPWLRAVVLVTAFPALLMGGWLWLAKSARGSWGRAMAVASLVLIAVLPARIYYAEWKAHRLTYPPTLADNGYSDLLRAAETVDDPTVNFATLADDELLTYLNKHAQALDLAAQAVHRPIQAVIYESTNDWQLIAEGKRIRRLSEILAARGRLELDRGRVDEAIPSYLANIELGAGIANGGIMMHDFVGGMCELAGVEGLRKIIARLDDDACRRLAERLAEIDAGREPMENVAAREQFYLAGAYPWKHRLNSLARALFPDEPFTNDRLLEAAGAEKRARLRLLLAHLALRRFWLATNEYPATLGELVPKHLAAVPLDPFADRDLTYKKLSTGYLLYSVGSDRVDDGGAPAKGKPIATGDVVADVVLPD
ncbi:MAG TPA: hypothetical protein VHC22_23260 [Pirellulales bacterium]|nr:hypothetical protein [Pirellulales bacterium]